MTTSTTARGESTALADDVRHPHHRIAQQEIRPDKEYATDSRSVAIMVIKHAIMIAISLGMLYPLLWMLSRSFMPNELLFRDASLIPNPFITSNYPEGWTALAFPFHRFIGNTVLIVALVIVGNLFSTSVTAYAFARLRFKLRTPMFAIMLVTIMLPAQITLIPQYIIWNNLGVLDRDAPMLVNILPLVLPAWLGVQAFFVFLLVQFIRGIPRELDEAARIDGAGHVRIFGQIMLPLMKPALATVAIFSFIWTWNDFLGPLLYLTQPNRWTVARALRQFIDPATTTNFAAMFAVSLVTLIPLFLVFLFGQKWLVQGIATTGGK